MSAQPQPLDTALAAGVAPPVQGKVQAQADEDTVGDTPVVMEAKIAQEVGNPKRKITKVRGEESRSVGPALAAGTQRSRCLAFLASSCPQQALGIWDLSQVRGVNEHFTAVLRCPLLLLLLLRCPAQTHPMPGAALCQGEKAAPSPSDSPIWLGLRSQANSPPVSTFSLLR